MLSDQTATDYRDALNFRLAAQNTRHALPPIQIPVAEGSLGNPFSMGDKKLAQFHVKGDDLFYSLDDEDKIIYVADIGSRHKVKRTINLKSLQYSIYENQWGILGNKIYGLAKTEHSNVADAWWTYGIDNNILRTYLFPATYNVWNDIEPVENFGTLDKSLIFDYDNDRILLACYNVGRNTFTGTFTMPAGEFTSTEGGSFDGSGASYPFGPLLDFDTSYFGPDDDEDNPGWVDIEAETSRNVITPTFGPSLAGQEYGAVIMILNDDNTVEHFMRNSKPVMWFFRADSVVSTKPYTLAPIHMDKTMNSSQRLVLSKSYIKDDFLYANCRTFRLSGTNNTNFELKYLGPVVWHFKTTDDNLNSYLTNLTYRYMWDYTEDSDNRASAGVEPILNINDEEEVLRLSPTASFANFKIGAWNNNSNLIPVIQDEILRSGVSITKSEPVATFEEQDWVEDVLRYCNMVIDEDNDIIWFTFLDRAFSPDALEADQPTGFTSLVRYSAVGGFIQFAEIVELDWQNPVGGYSFDVIIPEELPGSVITVGIVSCHSSVNIGGFYSVSDYGHRYSSDGNEVPFRVNDQFGTIHITPDVAGYMTPGVDIITVRRRLDTGQFSDIQVRIVFYDHEATELKKPSWNSGRYEFSLSRSTSPNVRTFVGNVSALGADVYRKAATVSDDWDMEATTGDLYWAGDEAIPEDVDVYNIIIEAANTTHAVSNTTRLDEGVTQTVVVVNVED